MGYPPFLLLCVLGTAIIVQAQNCSYPSGGPYLELVNSDILLEYFPPETVVTFACKLGHVPTEGTGEIRCTAGSWSTVKLKCERRYCPSMEDLQNGNVDFPTGTQFGDEAEFSCNTGYRLIGSRTRLCGNGGWLGRMPTCEVVTCDEPQKVEKAVYTPIKEYYEYADSVSYKCNKGLHINGSRLVSCEDDGTFKPSPPLCVNVKCYDPIVPFSEWAGGSRPPYDFRHTVTLQCVHGYVMIGSHTISCDINSQWSPKPPTCQRKPPPPTPPPQIPPSQTPPPKPPVTEETPAVPESSLPKILGAVFGTLGICAILLIGFYCCGCLTPKKGSWDAICRCANEDPADVALSVPISS